jgi:type VI secretion system protein ImpJ
MKLLSRVVWSEGMYLAPHHFQVQSRYFEDSIQFATSSLWFAGYGLAGIDLDAEAAQNGVVSVVHARGVFPDGLPFNMPESDALPEPRPIADLFPPTADGLIVSLSIPPRKANGYNCSLDPMGVNGSRDARYLAEARKLHDENTGSDERDVRIGRKNVRLLLDTEPAGDLQTLPIARVVRDRTGHFAYDPDFVPPLLQTGASARLMLLTQRLIDILSEKSATISRSAGPTREFASHEIANFWLLHCVNSALAPLRHLLIAKRGHPEELFGELSRLAGALCTFKLESHPRNLPLYDHNNLSDCFERVDRHIREHLEAIIPTNVISIPLRQVEPYYWEGDIADTRVFNRSRWVFGVRAALPEAELMSATPRLIKICTPPFVRELVKRALPGFALTHLPTPPPAISARLEAQYFGVSRVGPCWDHMLKTHQVGIYVPGEFPEPEIELLVVLEN